MSNLSHRQYLIIDRALLEDVVQLSPVYELVDQSASPRELYSMRHFNALQYFILLIDILFPFVPSCSVLPGNLANRLGLSVRTLSSSSSPNISTTSPGNILVELQRVG